MGENTQAYEEMIYSATAEKTEMPYIYRWVLSNYYSFKSPPQDNETLSELCPQITEPRIYVNDIENKTAQMRRMLGGTPIKEALEHLPMLLEWQKVNPNEEIWFYIDIFNLGYIDGKRAERKRKRLQIRRREREQVNG